MAYVPDKYDAGIDSAQKCPRCGGTLNRTPRRGIDRLLCLIVSVRRYRCRALGCHWEGNLRVSAQRTP